MSVALTGNTNEFDTMSFAPYEIPHTKYCTGYIFKYTIIAYTIYNNYIHKIIAIYTS